MSIYTIEEDNGQSWDAHCVNTLGYVSSELKAKRVVELFTRLHKYHINVHLGLGSTFLPQYKLEHPEPIEPVRPKMEPKPGSFEFDALSKDNRIKVQREHMKNCEAYEELYDLFITIRKKYQGVLTLVQEKWIAENHPMPSDLLGVSELISPYSKGNGSYYYYYTEHKSLENVL